MNRRMLNTKTPSVLMLATTLCWASACEGGKPSPSEAEQEKHAAEVEPSTAAKPVEHEQTRTPAVVGEIDPSPTDDDRPAPPAWFDASKIEHQTVVNQMASQGRIAGGYASAMVLELEPGATAQDCIDMARKALGETLPEVPEASAGDDGRLMLQGEVTDATIGYHYTVVCGEAKGKPTMYMSYTAKQ